MSMLIRGGLIHTMTKAGCYVGDILIRGDRIVKVEQRVEEDEAECTCVLEAHGLHVLPGIIDPYIQSSAEIDSCMINEAQSAGVTAGLLLPEREGRCRLLRTEVVDVSRIYALNPEEHNDADLHDFLKQLAENGMKPLCRINSAADCQRVLQMVHSTHVQVILASLAGCEELLEAIGISGCPVILGVSRQGTVSPWSMAVKLDEMGVKTALTTKWPSAKPRHLPLCAALCVREGLDRERAINMITRAPGAICGLPDEGCIATGCLADLAIYDGDPLLLATSHVMTISGGKIRH